MTRSVFKSFSVQRPLVFDKNLYNPNTIANAFSKPSQTANGLSKQKIEVSKLKKYGGSSNFESSQTQVPILNSLSTGGIESRSAGSPFIPSCMWWLVYKKKWVLPLSKLA